MITEFYKPVSVMEALEIAERENAAYFAGGTEINFINSKAFFEKQTEVKHHFFKQNKKYGDNISYNVENEPEYEKYMFTGYQKVVSIENLKLDNIEKNNNEIIIGSSVTIQDLIDNRNIPEILKKACRHIVNRNIRNIATLGGNIGSNKSCSNLIPALVVMKTELTVADSKSERRISVYDYIHGNEKPLILNIIIPDIKGKKFEITKFSRTANDISILTAAVSFRIEDETIADAVIAVGGVSKKVIRLTALENKLETDGMISKEIISAEVSDSVTPISDVRGTSEFKKYLCGILVADIINSAYKA